MWGYGGNNKSCFFLMPPNAPDIGIITNSNGQRYLLNMVLIYEHGSFILEDSPGFYTSLFSWIIWYLWKARNGKFYENTDNNPMEVLRLAENEEQAWELPQVEINEETQGSMVLDNQHNSRVGRLRPHISGYRCFIDELRKIVISF